MNKLTIFVSWLLSVAVQAQPWRDGDLLFQTSQSSQSLAIRIVTRSPLSHCGILWHDQGQWWVFEAAATVQRTPLDQFIRRGHQGYYQVKRYHPGLSPPQRRGLLAEVRRLLGRPYDRQFTWGDQKLYCSELIWMAYERGAGIRLGEPQRFGQLDLTSSDARALIRERRLPGQGELVVTPAGLARLPQLKSISNTYP